MDAKQTLGEPRVFISRSALLHNVNVLRAALKPGTKVCAVLKADAYGHGVGIVADALCNFSSDRVEAPAVDALCVATIDEAAAIGHVDVPVYVLRPVENTYVGRQRERIEAAIRAGWTLTVCSAAAASDVARLAVSLSRRASVQVMADTGMAREGCPLEGLDDLLASIDGHASLKLTAISTHFACSESPADAMNAWQLSRFAAATQFRAWKDPKLLRHAANSGAIFFAPEAQFDMVRPGLALYGIDPTGRPSLDRPLRPALRWTAPLLMTRDLKKGDPVGYGQTFVASRPMRVGVVPVGYADGYLRAFSNRASMRIGGAPCPVVGRVSMDYTTIDLTAAPHAQAGDPATILDNDPLSPASAYLLAQWADTIPYEVFCRIGSRVARIGVEPMDEVSPRRLAGADDAALHRESA